MPARAAARSRRAAPPSTSGGAAPSTREPDWDGPTIPLAKLRLAEWNPRVISEERFRNVVESLAADPRMLELRPVVANKAGIVYMGNMRTRAAIELGWKRVPAVTTPVSDAVAKQRAIRDNEQWGEWHGDQLAELVYKLASDGVDVSHLGLDQDELARLAGAVSPVGDAGEFKEVDPDKVLGKDRVQCPRCQFEFVPGAK